MPKKNNSQEYWAKRRQQDKIKVINTGENGINNLKKLLKNNLDDVEKQITKYFEKYADKKENLSPKELLAYKKKLKDAVKKVPNDKILKKLLVDDAPKYKIDRLRALQTDLQLTLTEATIAQEKGIANTLDDVSKVSQSVLAKSMKDAIGLSFSTIASKKLKQILSSDWSGATWSDRLWKDRELVGKKLTDILERGMVQGTSLQKMSRELKQVTGQSFNNAFRLIRTETSFIDTQVTFEGYEQARIELGLEYYKYDAHLDSRTSMICREMDGKIFKITEKEIGVNAPPLHPNCRSTIQLILDDEDIREPIKELKEFKDFGEFNRKGYGLADFVKSDNLNKKEQIKFARKFYDKNTLNSFYNIGKLNKESKELLGCKIDDIKFSIDSMIKNRIEHPDLNFYDYKKIPQILENYDNMSLSKKPNHIVMLKTIEEKPYQLVLKTTKNKQENFIVSFHRCD